MSWRVDEAESCGGRLFWRAASSEEMAAMALTSASVGLCQGLRGSQNLEGGRKKELGGQKDLKTGLKTVSGPSSDFREGRRDGS